MVTGVDWFPTLAEFCGIELPGHHIDGKSIKKVILSKKAISPHETFYWQLGSGKAPEWVVREDAWKLHGNPRDRSNKAPITEDDQLFLANLEMDPTEMANLASQYPEVVKRLSDLQSEYWKSIEKTLNSEK